MATPNMAAITASLERSLQNCSLNHNNSSGGPDSPPPPDYATPTLELNSEASLPFHWEQCLDLKSGEVYYINWRTGTKATEDPRTVAEYGGVYYSEDESEGSSWESSPSSREQWSGKNNEEGNENNWNGNTNNNVLVVGGCKSCFMYYMVPKHLQICPKCCRQLLHFHTPQS